MMGSERSYASLGEASVGDLSQAWEARLLDAETLLAAGRFPSAVAMGVYALEICLKARICARLEVPLLPKAFEIHDLKGLLLLSGLSHRLEVNEARPTRRSWGEITRTAGLVADHRYRPNSVLGRSEAEAFFVQLNDPSSGVLPWILSQP